MGIGLCQKYRLALTNDTVTVSWYTMIIRLGLTNDTLSLYGLALTN